MDEQPTREEGMITPISEFIKKYGSKLTIKEMLLKAEKYGLAEARKFVVKRHPEIQDAVLIGSMMGENADCEPDVLIYKNEKTGEIFSEPEHYFEIYSTREGEK